MRKRFVTAALACLLLAPFASAQKPADLEKPLKYGATRLGMRQDAAMQKFRDARLGAFIHWGLYAIPGGEWKGKTYRGAAEFLKSMAGVSTDEWMKLMDQWNPTEFDATKWAKMFKDMGVKYVKITTKHHEGFCLWPSKYTKYNIANTPYKKDLIGEVVKAFNKEGIDVGLYYSVLDWSHPDWRYDIKTEEDKQAFDRFLQFAENQLRELATRYPTVIDFWFDGTWDASVKKNGWWTAKMERMLKELIPGVTVNSRLRADDYGARHFDTNGHLMGDYESGYERRLPDPVKDLKVTRMDWEAAMTIPENQWGYHKDWTLSYVKTNPEVLENVVHAVSMGGNMLVNFGPQGNGDFRPEEKQLAQYIGKWMKENGEAIYGCGYAGLTKQSWGYFTKNHQNEIYMIVFNRPVSDMLKVAVPKGLKVTGAQLLHKQELKVYETTTNQYNVSMKGVSSEGPWVIKLKTESGEQKNSYSKALI
jgi:alpha-L-fucosidase